MDGELNQSGVALALTLARYFNRGFPSPFKMKGSSHRHRMVTMVKRYHNFDHLRLEGGPAGLGRRVP